MIKGFVDGMGLDGIYGMVIIGHRSSKNTFGANKDDDKEIQ